MYIRLRAEDLRALRRKAQIAEATRSASNAVAKAREPLSRVFPKLANWVSKAGFELGLMIAVAIAVLVVIWLLGGRSSRDPAPGDIVVAAVLGSLSLVALITLGGRLLGKLICLVGTTYILAAEKDLVSALNGAIARMRRSKRCVSPMATAQERMTRLQPPPKRRQW